VNKFKLYKIIIVITVGGITTPAFAYVDPGTGAMVVQTFMALLVAVIFYFRHPRQLWRDFKAWLKKEKDS
jgi:O-antigen/teichoic acid export membrane protein